MADMYTDKNNNVYPVTHIIRNENETEKSKSDDRERIIEELIKILLKEE